MKIQETTASNRATIERFSELVLAGDLENAKALLHPDFVLTEAEGLPYGGKWFGFDGLLRLLGKMTETWADLAIETRSIIGEPDGSEFGLLMQIMGKSSATGKSFTTTAFEHWVVHDGKIAAISPHYWDTKALSTLHTPVGNIHQFARRGSTS